MILRQVLLFLTTAGLLVGWRMGPEWPIFQALIVALSAGTIIAWVLHRFNLQWSWALLPLLAIPLWPAAQLALGTTVYRSATILELLRWNTYIAVFVLAFWSDRRRAEINWPSRAVAVLSLLAGAEGTPQPAPGNGQVGGRCPPRT